MPLYVCNNHTKMHSTSRRQPVANNISMADWNESSYNLHLDLYNFESSDANYDSPYILTSPRSLEACTQLEVKPIELLHKDLMQFEEESVLAGQAFGNGKMLYEQHEQQRLRKLKQCRRLRERLVLEQDDDDDNIRCNISSKPRHSVLRSPKKDQINSIKNKAVEFGQGDNKDCSTNTPQQLTSAQRISQRSPSMDLTSSRPVTNPTNKTNASSRKHWKTTQSTITYQPPSSPVTPTPPMRSKVIGQRSMSSCSSRQSVRSRQSSASAASIISDQDQKILDLLEKKYKDEKFLEETRQEVRLAWDEQRESEERSKVVNEMQRRKNLAEANSLRQKKKEKYQRQGQFKKEQEIKDAEMDIQYRDIYHERLVKEQQTLMRHQHQLKKLEDADKKNKQERILKWKEDEDNEYRQAVTHHAALAQERVERLCRQKENREAMENKRRNLKEKLRHSSMKASLDKDDEEYMNTLKESILMKQSRAQQSLSNQQWLQEHEIRLNREKEESLQEKSRQLRQEMEDENRQWQRQLMHLSLTAQERASQQANETVQSKANKARHARRSRELTQRELKQRVEEDEALYQESIKMNLAYKDMKSRSVAAHKQDAIMRSRVVAMESAKLRDQIRRQYQGSFDKMVQLANQQATFSRGPQMSTKNLTTFTLT